MKKFSVTIMYHGCISREIEATDAQEALEKARCEDSALDSNAFCAAAEFIEEDHDCEEL